VTAALATGSEKSLWEVFWLFTIPVGGGIPAGVVLGQKREVGWATMMVLYFLSDVLLAIVFEPILKLFIAASERYEVFAKIRESFRQTTAKTISVYGTKPGPFALVMIAFGVDPMTGRAAAMAAGHHFISGWAIAITGDMIFFTVIMVSTIWLNNILGDGTWTAIIIMIAMIGIPALIRKLRNRKKI
jgi:hypothetical protein